VNNTFKTDFKIDTGVKQGDPLSPMLFNLVIDTVLTQLDLTGNISTRLKQMIAYADDILTLARTKGSLIEALQQLKKSSIKVGLRINEEKTKYLKKCSKKVTNKEDLPAQIYLLNKCIITNIWDSLQMTTIQLKKRLKRG
jgi:hypothetical protein